MARVLQIIDVDSDGFKVRLDDGRVILMAHGGEHPQVGQEVLIERGVGLALTAELKPEPEEVKAPTIDQLNSKEQAQAQALSETVERRED